MSKSVLVINTPKYCALCVLRSGVLHPFCRVNNRDITDLSIRPDWCPLTEDYIDRCEMEVVDNPELLQEIQKMIEFKENELYQEIEIFLNDKKVGEAEVDLKGKMLSRLSIFPPYQNKGYGTQIVKMLNEKYGCNVLWVNADNKRAIHTYQKNGYEIAEPTMFLMKRGKKS